MDIKRNGSRPSGKGPAEWFTGSVRIDPLFEAPEPAHGRGANVTFEPSARTAWHTHPLGQTVIVTAERMRVPRSSRAWHTHPHTHPLGQTVIVTAGLGRAQRWGGPVEEIR